MDPYKPPAAVVEDPPTAPPGLSIGRIARDVAILWVLTAIGGFVIGLSNAGARAEPGAVMLALALSNLLLGTIGFTISGSLARGPRWQHLLFVALGLWVTSLLNVFLGRSGMAQWLLAGTSIALMMGVGGGLSYIFKRSDRVSG